MSVTVSESPLVERVAHSYEGALYLLPCDEEEGKRLLRQHRLYTRLFSGRLIIPPISFAEQDNVLDIGTGEGSWLCDVRAQLPESVHIYGIDIDSRLFPAHFSSAPNVHHAVLSAISLPSDWTNKFSLVHQRLMIFSYDRAHWRRGIAEMYRVLKPGGYVQLFEIGPEYLSGPKTAKEILFIDEFIGDKGMMMRCAVYVKDLMKEAGFVDVRSEDVVMKLGKWAGEDGIEGRDSIIGAFKGLRDSLMRVRGFGRYVSGRHWEQSMDEVAEEWDNIEGSYTTIRVCYGRKPTQ